MFFVVIYINTCVKVKLFKVKCVSSKLAAKECSRDKEASSSTQNTAGGCPVVVTNPMSVSVPNLACSDANNTLEPTTATGLLETFTAMARRRTLG